MDDAAADPDQLEAAAAEIADDAIGVGDAGDDTEARQPRLIIAADHLDAEAARLSSPAR